MEHGARPPLVVGGLFALLSAALFGASTPFLQRYGAGVGPYTTAGVLYTGAALVSLTSTRGSAREAPLRLRHLPRVAGVALAGALIAPACLASGLLHTSAALASLLLASEAAFTVALARIAYREPVGRRVVLATAFIATGAAVLLHRAGAMSASGLGSAALVVLAAVAWAVDSVASRPLADLDPGQVVLAKSLMGVLLAVVAARASGEGVPATGAALGLLITGALGYGTSLRLYLGAQRRIGAARTGSIFASAPFLGAVVAVMLGDSTLGTGMLLGAACILIGVYLQLGEQHGHGHIHEAMDHEHAHRHDDGHHDHVHDPPVTGEHSHPHHHEATRHEHPHGPDIHHQHSHD